MNEEELLRNLPREAPPPPELEERVVEALRAQGLIRQRRRLIPLAAAAVALFVIGFIAGRWEPAPPRSFILLLHESPRTQNDSHVPEYVRWARNDFVIGGAKLADEGRASDIGGYFVIAAESPARANEIAKTCPHLRYGGTIEVREIER